MRRRRFLQGLAGATLALPALELFGRPEARAQTSPPRLLVYYLPNGRRPEWWVPSSNVNGLIFPAESSALQPYADRALSLVGLDNTAATASPGAAHAMGTATVMTGTAMPDLNGLKNNVSLDQLVAQAHGSDTRFRSLQWSAGEPGPCDVGGSSCAYTQSVSWAGPSQPLIPTIDPSAAFDRLFNGNTDGLSGPEAEVRKRSLGSVLDHVRDDARDLESRLGVDDRARLEEYFTALRELEKRLGDAGPTCEVPESGPGGALDYPSRVQAFHELIRFALSCDQTRVLSFMIEFGLSGRSHDFIDAAGGHHALSHYGSTAQYERLRRLERWHSEQVAHLLSLLSSPDEDGHSLLDETLVLVMPSMGEGSSHNHARNCPLLFGGGASFRTDGRQIVFDGADRLANLHVTLLEAYGIEGSFGLDGARFGDDGDAVISGILS